MLGNNLPILTIVFQSDKTWLFSWASTGDPSYNVVLEGKILQQVSTTSYNFKLPHYDRFPPPLEIVPSTKLALSQKFIPFAVIQWYGEPSASYYQVDEQEGSSWTTRQTVKETGGTVYTFVSPVLADESFHTYRVRAFNSIGVPSAPLEFTFLVVTPKRHADGHFALSYNRFTLNLEITGV